MSFSRERDPTHGLHSKYVQSQWRHLFYDMIIFWGVLVFLEAYTLPLVPNSAKRGGEFFTHLIFRIRYNVTPWLIIASGLDLPRLLKEGVALRGFGLQQRLRDCPLTSYRNSILFGQIFDYNVVEITSSQDIARMQCSGWCSYSLCIGVTHTLATTMPFTISLVVIKIDLLTLPLQYVLLLMSTLHSYYVR